MVRLVWGCLLTTALAFGAGCGGSATVDPQDQGPSSKDALEDLAALLKASAEEKKRPPANLAGLEPYEGVFLSATLGIHQKRIVYLWGTALTGGTAVVAYDANVASAGGFVLLQDGTVKQMTVEEFQAAPKAKK
jgi:hypothetical protein